MHWLERVVVAAGGLVREWFGRLDVCRYCVCGWEWEDSPVSRSQEEEVE